jgi:hypothetical protein
VSRWGMDAAGSGSCPLGIGISGVETLCSAVRDLVN